MSTEENLNKKISVFLNDETAHFCRNGRYIIENKMRKCYNGESTRKGVL